MKTEKIKCRCVCHNGTKIKHTTPCCENGYAEIPVFNPSTGNMKLQLDANTYVTVTRQTSIKAWRNKYPDLKII